MVEQLPLVVAKNVSSTGTDLVGYLTQAFGFSAFVRDEGAVYHTYSTTGRGVEFLMGYYPILDHAPKGRDEGEAWQVWIRDTTSTRASDGSRRRSNTNVHHDFARGRFAPFSNDAEPPALARVPDT